MSEIRAERVVFHARADFDGFDVHCAFDGPGPGQVSVMGQITPPLITTIQRGDLGPGPAFRMDHTTAKAFMEAMWKAGIRPEHYQRPSAPEGPIVAAQAEHIDDLRKILARVLPPKPTGDTPGVDKVGTW